MKKWSKALFIVLALLAVLLTACGDKDASGNKEKDNNEVSNNLTDSGMPIVNDSITLKMFAGMSPATANNWNDVLVWNHYEEMTGIQVEFEQVSADSLEEKRNLALAGGTLPDVFYAANIPSLDLLKYGEQGTFIPLNDLIEEHAPNLKALFEENPDIRKSITFPDGNIYSLPYLTDPDFTSLRTNPLPWFNQKTLDKFDMEVPETLDDFYNYLVAVKEEGEEGEVPFGTTGIYGLLAWLKGSYDIGNTGRDFIDKDPETGDIRFYTATENYKEMLQFVNKLYAEGLIEQNIFTIEWDQYLANAAEGKYASTVFYSPIDLFGEEVGSNYVGGMPLEGPYGDKKYVSVSHPVFHPGKFAITSENKHPEASIRWADYFYGDEGSKLWYMGIEGETFEIDADGNYKYVDKIINSEDGLSKEQEIVKYLGWVGVGAPSILKQEYFDGSESAPQPVEASEKLEPFLAEEVWPGFTYTDEESKILSSVGADIEKYVNEMQDKFITGDASFDEWDNYVNTLEKMGLDKYMEVQKDAYDRYEEN